MVSPGTALQMLRAGNERFVRGDAQHPHHSTERRKEVVGGQHAIAVVLSCADSRVPPVTVFDRGLGDLFVIRNAGNVVDAVVLGSIEYAVEQLGIPLIVILGHSMCGAVTAALAGDEAPGHIQEIIDLIQPAVAATATQGGDKLTNAVVENVKLMVKRVQRSKPVVAAKVNSGQVQVVGAVYHLESGIVEFL